MHNQAEGGSRTWVVTVDDRVVAHYASSTAVVLRAEATYDLDEMDVDQLIEHIILDAYGDEGY